MRYRLEIEIDAPIEHVADLVGDPDRWEAWLEGLDHVEHLSGTPGMPGAESRLTFVTGGRTIEMHGTVIERNLPEAYRQTMEAPHVSIDITTKLEPLGTQRTRYVSEQTYTFRGLRDKLLGLLMRRMFTKQTKRHVANFKELAEA